MTHQSSARGQAASDWLAGAVKNNPEGLLLLAAGCALLLRSSKSSGRSTHASSATSRGGEGAGHTGRRQSGMASGMAESMSEAAQSARDYASDIGKTVGDKASEYASSVGDYADETRRTVVDHSERLVEQARTTMQSTVGRVLREQPLALAIAGLAAGAAVAAAFPATEVERQTLGPAGERVSEAASNVGKKVTQAASKAGEKLKDIADERGLNSEGLKEAAGDVAGAFEDAFKGHESGARSQSSGSGPNYKQSSSDASPQSPSQTSPLLSDKANKPGAAKQT
jgi:hypothetical protein